MDQYADPSHLPRAIRARALPYSRSLRRRATCWGSLWCLARPRIFRRKYVSSCARRVEDRACAFGCSIEGRGLSLARYAVRDRTLTNLWCDRDTKAALSSSAGRGTYRRGRFRGVADWPRAQRREGARDFSRGAIVARLSSVLISGHTNDDTDPNCCSLDSFFWGSNEPCVTNTTGRTEKNWAAAVVVAVAMARVAAAVRGAFARGAAVVVVGAAGALAVAWALPAEFPPRPVSDRLCSS